MSPRFANTSCSQCGGTFGPGNAGFSHCQDHQGIHPENFNACDKCGSPEECKTRGCAGEAIKLESVCLPAPTDLLEAVRIALDTAPCDCPRRMREEHGEHLSGCFLFDLNIEFGKVSVLGSESMAPRYKPGSWTEIQNVDDLERFYWSRLPDIREAAKDYGYAIGVHGSLRRDMDLIAVPWREDPEDVDELAHAIALAACGIERAGRYDWEQKPAGRIATSIPICWPVWHGQDGAGHIDLSVMPAIQAPGATHGEPT